MREVKITAQGELSRHQEEVVLRYLGRWGLTAESSVSEESGPSHNLGYITIDDLIDYEVRKTGREKDKAYQGIRLINNLYRIAEGSVADRTLTVGFNGEQLELFVKDPDHPRYPVINLDTLSKIEEANLLTAIPLVGKQTEQMIQEIIGERRQKLLQDTSETPES